MAYNQIRKQIISSSIRLIKVFKNANQKNRARH